ncbi:hypothetical protein [Nocardioides panzhihuensis]|uniref:Uncharacterized protein n=1 Tax=Nocardioides panzhihuensis TaxID=860243 RepID=A0A7Z0DTT7_9ACTN|nr:hypothetical protein [Nocardioides panzhihuensis]NYI81211.1 hypothetical protein [Nocardioides panzhihuensis]
MANQPDRDDTKQRSIFVTAAIGGLLVIVIVLAAALVFSNRDGAPTSDPTGGGDPATSGSPASTAPAVPEGFVTLPAPATSENGYPIGYPHNDEGAAAFVAAYEVSQVALLDYDKAESWAPLYIAPTAEMSYSDVAENLVTLQRKNLGVELNGPAPAGPSAAAELEGIKWEAVATDVYLVSVSMSVELTKGDGSTSEVPVATGAVVYWEGDRWWIDLTGSRLPDLEELEAPQYAKPGTAAYTQAGWQVVKNSDWKGSLL